MNQSNKPEQTGSYSDQSSGHLPVLLQETVEAVKATHDEVFVDLTAGRGGHATAVARGLGPKGTVVLFDLDGRNLTYAAARVRSETGITPVQVHGSFAAVGRELTARGIVADIVLADLGFASNQVDDPTRGLSFMRDGPLDMRMDPTRGMTAADLVNLTSERELSDLISRYGEEPMARKIATKIAAARLLAPIQTTAQLAELVREAYGSRARTSRMHPATKTFMALRIAVNDELGALSALLDSISTAARRVHDDQPTWLRRGSRIAIIGFHSLEDRLVKRCFADMRKNGFGSEITNGLVISSETESAENPRARSAKLRAVMVDLARQQRHEAK